MRFLLLLFLLAGGAGYLYYQRQHNYPMESVTTTAGLHYDIKPLPDECVGGALCVHRVVFLTGQSDAAGLRREADGLVPWVDSNLPAGARVHGLLLIALEPGFLRLRPPRRMIGLVYARVGSRWQYMTQSDVTEQMKQSLLQ